jgi:hypothetical protein
MRDLIGNKIEAGNLVYCPSKQQICKVTDVREPKISDEDPILVLELQVPMLNRTKVMGEIIAHDFIRVIDPNQEAVLNKILQ